MVQQSDCVECIMTPEMFQKVLNIIPLTLLFVNIYVFFDAKQKQYKVYIPEYMLDEIIDKFKEEK